jgi:hypothetical protein
MISLPVIAGVLVLAAAATAITVSDGRAVAIALFVALLISPFAASPLPGALEIAARAVAALLAAYVLWIVMKGGAVKSEGTAIGIGAELAFGAAAYVLGWWLQPVHPLQGPLGEQATGFALVALAVLPLSGSNVLRAGVGVMLLALGMSFVMETWLGPSPALAQLALTALLLVIPGALSLLVDVDDEVAKVVPATENVRPEEPLAPEPEESVFVPSVMPDAPSPRKAAAAAAAARAAERAAAAAAPAAGESSGAPDSPVAPEPGAEPVVGPRPSIRFLGRNAPVRGGDSGTVSQARRQAPSNAETGAPNRGRRLGSRGTAPSEKADEPAAPPAEPEAEPGAGAGETLRIRDGRDPRNPRTKRPLR